MSVAAALALLLVVVGSLVVGRLSDEPGPTTSEVAAVEVTPVRRDLVERVTVRGIVAYQVVSTVRSQDAAVVSTSPVPAASVLESGAELLRLNGRPVIAVAGEIVFWRPLAAGDTGEDVAALQELLAASGDFTSEISGEFGPETTDALTRWQATHGFQPVDGILQPSDMAVGSWPARVGAVQVERGEHVAPGAPLLTLTEEEPVVAAQITASDRLRVSVGDEAAVNVGAAGTTELGSVAFLGDQLVGEPDSLGYELVVDGLTLEGAVEGADATVVVILDEAHDVLAVPVAAIVPDAQGNSAVIVVTANGEVTVPVTLGLSEGAFVEVVAGLQGNERIRMGV